MSSLLQLLSKKIEASASPVGFETTGTGAWPVWHRFLTVDGKRAYSLGNVCGTCAFLFERLEGANGKPDVEALTQVLASGVKSLNDDIISPLSLLMPASDYRISLLRLVPRLVMPGSEHDYFTVEQVEQRGVDPFWGLPHHPRVSYYRPEGRSAIDLSVCDAALFDFIVPMFPERWLDEARIKFYIEAIEQGAEPTAVSLSILDAKEIHDIEVPEKPHWCMAHYVLDGHHKIAAAARTGKPITLIAFHAVDHGVSEAAQVDAAIASY